MIRAGSYYHRCDRCGWAMYCNQPTVTHHCKRRKVAKVSQGINRGTGHKDCIYKGVAVDQCWSRGCPTSRRRIDVYECHLHQQCTLLSNADNIQWCKLCEDFVCVT